jgi:hypothetical protein
MAPPAYKFCDWVDQEKVLNSDEFCKNTHPATLAYLKANPYEIRWNNLSSNSSDWAGVLLRANLDQNILGGSNSSITTRDTQHLDTESIRSSTSGLVTPRSSRINWARVSGNSSDWAGDLLRANLIESNRLGVPNKINWRWISMNSSDWAGELLRANLIDSNRLGVPDRINWTSLSSNSSDWARDLLRANPNKIDWTSLSRNPSDWAGDLLRANLYRINWPALYHNASHWARELLRINLETNSQRLSESRRLSDLVTQQSSHINWYGLSCNSSDWAVELLRANLDRINWNMLAKHPGIFTYDYEQMRDNNTEFSEELARVVFHPDRISKLLETYGAIDI